MCPRTALTLPTRQRGAALVIAIFVIVVLALIGLTVVKLIRDSSDSTITEVYGTRTEAAARSAAEVFLTQLFPLTSNTANSSLCPARVNSVPQSLVLQQNLNAVGLDRCTINVYCDRLSLTAPYAGDHYRILAQAQCNAGDFVFSRQLLLEASDGID
ncbi:type II secretory pathway component [Pseudidiomarina aquimaris]|uniref:Type II secretory pathway component n=1 Tax=Pseudidiomarina aquimaris TaxID=641841 RepID=A0A432XNH4_9GAMM|nr:type II secretory pathway component [Pseudidiomarina aquimaris]RUO50233.1 type II secretory pathway component [Pseudidiomarina aquimaris]